MDYNARIEETVANILALRNQVVPKRPNVEAAQLEKDKVEPTKREAEAEEEVAAV